MQSRQVVSLLILLVCLMTNCFSQTETATVSGRVTDQQGAVVPGAQLVITNVDTNLSARQTSNKDGLYVLPRLKPGHYRITVTAAGFRTINLTDVVLNVQDTINQNFQLQLGSVSESVTVVADAATLNTTDASVSTVIDRNFAENIPMNGRSFQTLIQLTPGVVATAVDSDDGQFSVNGMRAASNYWMVDGVSANIGVGNAAAGQGEGVAGSLGAVSVQGGTNSLVSVDALQEFRIQTSTYAPEFGRTPGAQISIVTRSGTNRFHGTAFDYLRNDVVDANDWFASFTHQPKPKERQNDFGGTFSGPIFKDRTFFFFSYEGLRLRQPVVAQGVVPTVAARQAAIPAMQPFFNAFPLPNGPALGNGNAQFNASFSNASTLDATSLRIDHRVSDKLTIFGRYNYSPSELHSRLGGTTTTLSAMRINRVTIQTGTLGGTWSISSSLANDLRLNYSRSSSIKSFVQDSFGGAVPPPASAFILPNPFTPQNSFLQLGISATGALNEGAQGSFVQQQYNVVESLSLQKGSHSLKVGVDYRRLSPVYSPAAYLQNTVFATISSAQNGQLSSTSISTARSAAIRMQNLGMFLQDTWRVNPRLTLTYGLRWDLDFAPSSDPAFPAVMNFDPNNLSGVTLAPSGMAPYATTYGNIAPRTGAAYQVSQKGGWETVFRGGFGVFYDLASQQIGNLTSTSQYPFGASSPTISGGSYPLSSSQLAPPPISSANVSVGGINTFDPNVKLPYSLEWNVALEQALGTKQAISGSYVGSVGRRLLQSGRVLNPNPTFNRVTFVTNAATSDYHALQLQFQRRLASGLQALSSYTWSHSIDSASSGSLFGANEGNTFVPGIDSNVERGPSSFDIRHAFSAGVTYDIRAPKGNALMKAILGGWSVQTFIQARSAPPVNVFYSSFSLGSNELSSVVAIRPDVVAGKPLYLYGSQCLQPRSAGGLGAACPGGKGLNPNAFAPPPLNAKGLPVRQGNLSRNALRGFGATQWDFAIHRDFRLLEPVQLQFRAEMFNVLNHPNFAPPVGNLSSPTSLNPQFGQSIQMLSQSFAGGTPGVGGFSALYQIGTPRSIQLALRLQF